MALKSLKDELGLTEKRKPFAAFFFIQEKYLLYPGKGKSYDYKYALRFFILYACGLGFIFNFGIIGHFLMSSSDVMFAERIQSSFNIALATIQYSYLLIHISLGNEFMKFMKRIDSAEFGRSKKLLMEYRSFNKFCVAFMISTSILTVLFSGFHHYDNSFCSGRDILKDKRFVCGLSAPAWFPMEIHDGMLKNILTFMSFFYLVFCEPPSTMLMLGDIELTRLIQIKMMDLRCQMDQTEDVKSEQFKEKFKVFVAYYTEILGCINDLNNTMGYCMIPLFSLATTTLALLEFNVLISGNYIDMLVMMVAVLVEVGFTTIGENLENEV
ncbi:hypothetical protein HHI36_020072 [Cryptolaemus montrouzieri]|uniref:Odorant receptor n=1 Tax=Cryptolaemus montrouzieri TaxID=559131 RepID=A0ABD2N9Y1_9CUCU